MAAQASTGEFRELLVRVTRAPQVLRIELSVIISRTFAFKPVIESRDRLSDTLDRRDGGL